MAQDAQTAGALGTLFSPGRTLSTSFGVFGRNLMPFLAVTAIISLPYIAVQTVVDYLTIESAAAGRSSYGGGIALFIVQTITFGLVQAALTYGTVQDLRGQHAGVSECLKRGLARSGNIVSGAVRYGFLLGLATLLLVIPGIILYLRWWVFIPAMVVEGEEPKQSFQRSVALTEGRRWAIFGLTALIFVVEIAAVIGLATGLTMAAGEFIADIAVTLLAILFTAFASVAAAVGYYHLRAEKEGVVIEDIARVFD
jgi:hypothetical protein